MRLTSLGCSLASELPLCRIAGDKASAITTSSAVTARVSSTPRRGKRPGTGAPTWISPRRLVAEEAEPPEAIRPGGIEPDLRAAVDVLDQGAVARVRDDEALGVLAQAQIQKRRVPAVEPEPPGEIEWPEHAAVQPRLVQEPEHLERWPNREEDTVARPVLPGAQMTVAEPAKTAVADDEPFPPAEARARASAFPRRAASAAPPSHARSAGRSR